MIYSVVLVSAEQQSMLFFNLGFRTSRVFPGGSEDKASACNAGDLGSIPGLGRSPGEGNGNQLQYSCLENPMDRGAWRATVHGVAKSWTRLSNFTFFRTLSTSTGMGVLACLSASLSQAAHFGVIFISAIGAPVCMA